MLCVGHSFYFYRVGDFESQAGPEVNLVRGGDGGLRLHSMRGAQHGRLQGMDVMSCTGGACVSSEGHKGRSGRPWRISIPSLRRRHV